MLQEFFFENHLFSFKPSSTIAIVHSTPLLREYALYFFTIIIPPVYEEKISQLGNSRALPRRKRGLISPCLSLWCLAYQSIVPLVVICWSIFYFHGSSFSSFSNIYFLVVFSCIFLFSYVFGFSNQLTNFFLFIWLN
jgi:hypothetical protein